MSMHSTLIPLEVSKMTAEISGMVISDEVATLLCQEVEYRLRELTQDAMKFMRHSKRDKLITNDINSALRLRNRDILFGYGSSEKMPFVKVSGYKDLFFTKDYEVQLEKMISETKLPPLPRAFSYSVYWLAIDGVQPNIPQNPSRSLKSEKANKNEVKTQSLILDDLEVRPVMRHVISKELQELYEKLTNDVLSAENTEEYRAVQRCLSQDPGLHQLLPYFCQFLTKQVAEKLHDLPVLNSMMQVVHSLLLNPNIHLGNYLHQIIPIVLTCLVGKKLCRSPVEDHWSLRDFSAELLAQICYKWNSDYPTMMPRIIKTLVRGFLDLKKPVTTHYGAIVGLDKFGSHTRQLIILPNLERYLKYLDKILDSTVITTTNGNNNSNTNSNTTTSATTATNTNNHSPKEPSKIKNSAALINLKNEAQMCYQALLSSCGHYLFDLAKYYNSSEIILLKSFKSNQNLEILTSSSVDSNLKSIDLAGELLPMSKQYNRLYEIFGESIFSYITNRTNDLAFQLIL